MFAENGSEKFSQIRAAKVWNYWALSMVSERKSLERQGRFFGRMRWLWESQARVDFSDSVFRRALRDRARSDRPHSERKFSLASSGEAIDFRWFVFPGLVDFSRCAFDSWVWFGATRFCGRTEFRDCNFADWVGFLSSQAQESPCEFHDICRFDGCTFSDDTYFRSAVFHGLVYFSGCDFAGKADMSLAQFNKGASFFGARFNQGVILNGVAFRRVPDFSFATFSVAPSIPKKVVMEGLGKPINYVREKEGMQPVLEECYRALRRIASDSRDWGAERDYLVLEQESRADASLTFRVLLRCFALGCDYGRSAVRPLCFWFINALVFSGVYEAMRYSIGSFTWRGFFRESFYIAVCRNFPVLGQANSRAYDTAVTGLLGSSDVRMAWFDFLVVLQSTLAAIFLFLVAMCIRNALRYDSE